MNGAKTVPLCNTEPTDAGILPPEYRNPYGGQSSSQAAQMIHQHQQQQQQMHQDNSQIGGTDKKQPHQWSTNPVEEWAKEQVRIKFRIVF